MRGLYQALKGIALSNGYTHPQLARAVGMATGTFRSRMCGTTPFTANEMYKLLDFFRIPHSRLHEIFPPDGKKEA